MGPMSPVTSPTGFRAELRNVLAAGSQVWGLIPGRQKRALGLAALVMAITSAAGTAIPLVLGELVNAVEAAQKSALARPALFRMAATYLALLGLAYLVREAFNVLRRYIVEETATRIDKELCVRIVDHLMQVDLSTLTHEQVGALHGRIHRSVEGYVRFLRISFLDFFPALLGGSFALTATLTKEPRIALVMLGVVPVSLGLTVWQLLSQKGIRISLLRSREAMDGTVVELLGGLDYVRASNTQRQEIQRVDRTAEARRAKEIRHQIAMSFFGCGKALNEAFFHLMVVAFAVYLTLTGSMSFGGIIAFSGLFLGVMAPLAEVHRFIDEAHESSLRIGDLLVLLNQPPDRSFSTSGDRLPSLQLGRPLFEAEGLRVHYRTKDGRTRRALDGVSMRIHHGETIGVAGRSGSGKSTWLRVMMRLAHPVAGTARLGGVPLEDVSRETIGDTIGYVGQNPFVFAGTIAENIAYGHEDACPDAIRHAAYMACIHDEILDMPGGYDALVAERGQNLSGGQRQRLALARVFLKNPPVLILDEGTSALDNISERKVQQAINAARADRTVILVAHRLSTLLDADRILVFDEGRIVEAGSYEELVLGGGTFAELVRSAEEGRPEIARRRLIPAPAIDLVQPSPEILVGAFGDSLVTPAELTA